MEESVFILLSRNWKIKRKNVEAFGIDPDKLWDDLMVKELDCLAGFLQVTAAELIENTL